MLTTIGILTDKHKEWDLCQNIYLADVHYFSARSHRKDRRHLDYFFHHQPERSKQKRHIVSSSWIRFAKTKTKWNKETSRKEEQTYPQNVLEGFLLTEPSSLNHNPSPFLFQKNHKLSLFLNKIPK